MRVRTYSRWLLGIFVLLSVYNLMGTPAVVVQAAVQSAQPMITINGGGGVSATGADGIKITFNIAGSSEQLRFTNRNQRIAISDEV